MLYNPKKPFVLNLATREKEKKRKRKRKPHISSHFEKKMKLAKICFKPPERKGNIFSETIFKENFRPSLWASIHPSIQPSIILDV